ncbi:uncharacterized protein LOC120747007 [Simochromis diagramma]|uniref:uncharacterized protein LOC120747007 n=1 Tax=Simochromis diagramma TaxID=43689 RepID=UPI001A7EB044|nr:uncharacterized protein LOC120747007 [Simochromis diagramma]
MSKELRCRLIRNTMTSMIAILRAKGDGESHRYPSKPEITAMAKRIVQYYPMLQDQGIKNTWVTVYTELNKRLQNVRSPQKATPDGRHSKSSAKRRRLDQPSDVEEMDSSDSTIILDLSTEGRSSPESASKTSELEGKRKAQNLLEEEPSNLPSPNSESIQLPHGCVCVWAHLYRGALSNIVSFPRADADCPRLLEPSVPC